ncbi:MAG: hypothetical protein D6705_01400 [Deltaproteobacteria bacterium]|nr:MAG: hypothetical protein D6705_01400 [Deltaproteobacteria bacterium]
MSGPSPNELDALRRSLDVRIRRDGAITMKGAPVVHPRIRQAILDGLDVTDRGDLCFHFGGKWAYVTAEDTPLRARHVGVVGGRLQADLDDGRTVEVGPEALWADAAGLCLAVPSQRSGRRLSARVTNTALVDLEPYLAWDGEVPTFVDGGRRLRIPNAPPPAFAANEPHGA